MTQDITTRRCQRCNEPLPLDSYAKLRYCPPCRVDQTREDKLAGYHRRAAKAREARAVELTCPRCGEIFKRTKFYKVLDGYCHPCHEKLRLAVRNETKKATNKRKRAERYAREGRWMPCVMCGEMLSCAPTANRRFCGTCFAVRAANRRKDWLAANPDYKRFDMRRRVARRRSRVFGPGYEKFQAVQIFERDRWRCGICRKRIGKRLRYPHPMSASIDHTVPLSQGGQHNRANVRASHLSCNLSRGNKGGNEQLLLVG